jgi:DNA-binding MarR family transcriptional regulator
MEARHYFPLGKAQGEAFCNRVNETKWLADNIKGAKHSLLSAPRRFGKSSLAEHAVATLGLPTICINFNTCTDEQDVEKLLREGVSSLIGRALGSIEKLSVSIKKYVTHLTPKLNIGTQQLSLELLSDQQLNSPAINIEESLLLLEKLLAEKKKSAIIILDEFQVVGLIAKGAGVEAAIRNAAQSMHSLSLIFSGSSRSLLLNMFEDESRPLYKLCRKLHLKRMGSEHYRPYLDTVAKLSWKIPLDDAVFEKIMLLSEQHPYYVNYLCDVLWTDCEASPTIGEVEQAWQQVIEEEESDANAEIMSLSMGQKKVIKFIANQGGENLMAASTTKAIGMALSSLSGAISSLLEKDIVEKENDAYRIINPIFKALLKQHAL